MQLVDAIPRNTYLFKILVIYSKTESGQKDQTRFNLLIQPMISVFNVYHWLNAWIKPGFIFFGLD